MFTNIDENFVHFIPKVKTSYIILIVCEKKRSLCEKIIFVKFETLMKSINLISEPAKF